MILTAATAFAPQSLSAQIINIDFLAFRGTETEPANASGDPSGFYGAGTVYNGIVADNSAVTDNIFVSGTNLVDSHGVTTSVNFSAGPAGADDGGIGVFNGSYLFTNSANSHVLSTPFSISGLGTEPTAKLIFFTTFDNGINVPVLTFNGSLIAATPTSVVNNYTYEFDNVAVTGGIITGTIGTSNSGPLIFSGLAISDVPEPSTWALMGLAGFAVVWRMRRNRPVA
jgi:hypothetical protein